MGKQGGGRRTGGAEQAVHVDEYMYIARVVCKHMCAGHIAASQCEASLV